MTNSNTLINDDIVTTLNKGFKHSHKQRRTLAGVVGGLALLGLALTSLAPSSTIGQNNNHDNRRPRISIQQVRNPLACSHLSICQGGN